MTANAQTVTSTSTAQPVTWTAWFDQVFLENESGTVAVTVRADGLTAVAGAAGTLVVLPGQTLLISNGLPRPDINTSLATRLAGLSDTAHATQVSVVSASSAVFSLTAQ